MPTTKKPNISDLPRKGTHRLGTPRSMIPANITTREQLLQQATTVGAVVLLVRSKYKDTLSGVVPYTVRNAPQVSTVNTTGTINAYGSGGWGTATYNGQGTIVSADGTSTYGTPYAVSRNDVLASFWVLQDLTKVRLGMIYGALPDDPGQQSVLAVMFGCHSGRLRSMTHTRITIRQPPRGARQPIA
jgi:hypothetical protein